MPRHHRQCRASLVMDFLKQDGIDDLFDAVTEIKAEPETKSVRRPMYWRTVLELVARGGIIKNYGVWQPTIGMARANLASLLREGFHPKRCYIERLDYEPIPDAVKAKGGQHASEWSIVRLKR